MSSPMESPTISTRSGSAAVGVFGFGGAVVGVVVAAATPWPDAAPPGCCFPRDAPARGPEMLSPFVPPGCVLSRPVADTMRESCSPRLSAATGPVTSRLTVRRVPTGDTWALCWSVGAKRRNQSANAPAPSASTRVQGSRTRPSPHGAGWT